MNLLQLVAIIFFLLTFYMVIRKILLPYRSMCYYKAQGVIFPPKYIPFLGHHYFLKNFQKKNGGAFAVEYFTQLLSKKETKRPAVCGYLHGSVLVLIATTPQQYRDIVSTCRRYAHFQIVNFVGIADKAYTWGGQTDTQRAKLSRQSFIQFFGNTSHFYQPVKYCFLDMVKKLDLKDGIATVDLRHILSMNSSNIGIGMLLGKEFINQELTYTYKGQQQTTTLPKAIEINGTYCFDEKYLLLKNVIFDELYTYSLTQLEKERDAITQKLKSTVNKIVNLRQKSPFLNCIAQTCGGDPEKIIDECMDLLVATNNPTELTVYLQMKFLAANQEYIACLRQELTKHVNSDSNLISDIVEKFDCEHLSDCKLLTNCFYEAMRLEHSLPVSLYFEAVKGLKIDKVNVKTGENVIILLDFLHKDFEQWQEPFAFKPERFDESHPLYLTPSGKKRHVNSFVPFLPGPRSCPASKFVEFSVRSITAWMVLCFDIKMKGVDGSETYELAIRPHLRMD